MKNRADCYWSSWYSNPSKSGSPIVLDCQTNRPIITIIIWLSPRAGEMKRLPEGARRAHLAHYIGISALIPQKKFSFWPYNKYFIDQQACSVKMAGYFPRSYFAFFIKKAKKELGRCTSLLVKKAYLQLWPVQPIYIYKPKSNVTFTLLRHGKWQYQISYIRHPYEDELTASKIGHPLTSITWLSCRLM